MDVYNKTEEMNVRARALLEAESRGETVVEPEVAVPTKEASQAEMPSKTVEPVPAKVEETTTDQSKPEVVKPEEPVAAEVKEYAFKSNGSMLGASGAVMCISMLFVFNFPTARVTLFVFPVPAWVLGIILVLTNIVSSPTSSIATDVHLTGVLCAAAYFYFGVSFRFLGDIQGTWRRQWRKFTGPKLKIHNVETGAPTSEADEADRILAKIHESGQDSLSSKEKKFLEKYSRAVRQRKEQL